MAEKKPEPDVEIDGDIAGVKLIDKKYKDGAGAVCHQDFIQVQILVPYTASQMSGLLRLSTRHKRVRFSMALLQTELPFMDELEETKSDAAAKRAEAKAEEKQDRKLGVV